MTDEQRNNGWTSIFFANNNGNSQTFETWEECYNKVLKAKSQGDEKGDPKWAQLEKFIRDGGLDFVRELETSLNCASACKVPLFYATRSIADG